MMKLDLEPELNPPPRDKSLSFLCALSIQAKQTQAAEFCLLELLAYLSFSHPADAKA